jgi:hypothetical protein
LPDDLADEYSRRTHWRMMLIGNKGRSAACSRTVRFAASGAVVSRRCRHVRPPGCAAHSVVASAIPRRKNAAMFSLRVCADLLDVFCHSRRASVGSFARRTRSRICITLATSTRGTGTPLGEQHTFRLHCGFFIVVDQLLPCVVYLASCHDWRRPLRCYTGTRCSRKRTASRALCKYAPARHLLFAVAAQTCCCLSLCVDRRNDLLSARLLAPGSTASMQLDRP